HLRLPATLRNSPHPTLRTPHHIGGGLHQHPHFPLHLDAGQHPEPPNAEQNRSRFDTVNHDLWPPLSAVSCNHQEKRGHGSHHSISRLTRRPFAPHSSRRARFRVVDRSGRDVPHVGGAGRGGGSVPPSGVNDDQATRDAVRSTSWRDSDGSYSLLVV